MGWGFHPGRITATTMDSMAPMSSNDFNLRLFWFTVMSWSESMLILLSALFDRLSEIYTKIISAGISQNR
jgi:hypothetical protein